MKQPSNVELAAWLKRAPQPCGLCEDRPATTVLEVWRGHAFELDPSGCTPVCDECLPYLVRPIPNFPIPETEH